eukprot:1190891-Prorocentrum_minimum.AAC.3
MSPAKRGAAAARRSLALPPPAAAPPPQAARTSPPPVLTVDSTVSVSSPSPNRAELMVRCGGRIGIGLVREDGWVMV